jgi:hypothetical protein
MGSWYIGLAAGLFLVLIGLYTHWTIVLCGALLPFVPLVTLLLRRRRGRGAPDRPVGGQEPD